MMEIIMDVKLISTHAPAVTQIRKGVTKGARIVLTIVMETESATSARANVGNDIGSRAARAASDEDDADGNRRRESKELNEREGKRPA